VVGVEVRDLAPVRPAGAKKDSRPR
jgi:hypothetical protein